LYPMTVENAKALLACLPREVVLYLAKTIAGVAISRADAIMELVDDLPVKIKSPEQNPPPLQAIVSEDEHTAAGDVVEG